MLNRNKHEAVMLGILSRIFRNRKLKKCLGFKGGTAAYLFYDLPRFSVDLDFNLLNHEITKETILQEVNQIVSRHGTIKEQHNKRYTLFTLISYGDLDQNIKIEISTRNTNDNYDTLNYLSVPMTVMAKDYILAHKLVAITDRNSLASRDLFDIDFFLGAGWDFNKSVIKKRTGLEVDQYLFELRQFIETNFNSRNILQGLGELVDHTQKQYIKNELKDSALFKLDILLNKK